MSLDCPPMAGRSPESACRACGTIIPAAEPVLVKFRRCHYCGRYNPFGSNWRALALPGAIVAAMSALTAWWGQSLL